MKTFMEDYDITIRIFEGGQLVVCDAATVRPVHDFSPSEIYYNEPINIVMVPLTKKESQMIHRFRSKHPAELFQS